MSSIDDTEALLRDTDGSHAEDKDRRDQRILSAKKKLKSYRAKQALMAKRQSGSRQLTPSKAKRLSTDVTNNAIANAVQETILCATEQAQQDMHTGTSSEPSSDKNPMTKRHSRTASRAGHGRGHSRAASISVTADQMVSSANNALRNSFLASKGTDTTPSPSPNTTTTTSHVAHVRHHSRQHSRSASRQLSMIASGGLTPSRSNPTLLAVEHGPDSYGAPGAPSDWTDVPPSSVEGTLQQPQRRLSPAPSPSATPRASARPLSNISTADSLFMSTASSNAPATKRLSRHARRTSLATKRESMELMGGLGFPAFSPSQSSGLDQADSTMSAASNSNTRRASRRISSSNRFSGIQSASVLFGAPADRRSALKQDFDWRGSFGLNGSGHDQADEEAQEGEGDDRRTALEKLEGRSAASKSSSSLPSSQQGGADNAKRHSRAHSRQSSVQLPSFDDIHGQEGMDKRNSVNLLERNERSTLEESKAHSTSPWLGIPTSSSLTNLSSPTLGGFGGGMSHSQSNPELLANSRSPKPRPVSLFVSPEANQPEGLGTLMEEEEEEDVTSPIKEREAMKFASFSDVASEIEDEEAQRRRREEERETVKRTRRSSLQPKPLKLKSRPASLFVSPAMQMKANLMLQSPSPRVPEEAEEAQGEELSSSNDVLSTAANSSDADVSSNAASSRSALGWSFSTAQAKARMNQLHTDGKESHLGNRQEQDGPRSVDAALQTFGGAPRHPRTLSLNTRIGDTSTDNSSDTIGPEAASSSPTSATKPGMRALRLGGGSASQSSLRDETGNVTPTRLAQRRTSYMSTSSSGEGISERMEGGSLPSSVSKNTLRRSSIIYKPSSDAATSSPTVSTAPSSASMPANIMNAFEELKSKALQDAGTIEEQSKQIEKLTIDLSAESQRSTREYAQLEQWSAEQRQKLVTRIDELQNENERLTDAVASKDSALSASAAKLAAQQQEMDGKTEDLEAERDMLRDDVDGWRTRCGDLEKSARSDKASLEEERQHSYSLALRVQTLMATLKEEGINVPTTPTADDVASRQLGLPSELNLALRSPAINPYAPSVTTPSGYFSPRASPADATVPPPQAVKLLKDMRQQIFNLAGTLEHQRKEMLKYQEESETLKKQNEELKTALQSASKDGKQEDESVEGEHEDGFTFDHSPPPMSTSTSFERRNTGKQRHVFAYDSSMGSVDQSNTSMGSTSHTNMTTMSEHSHTGNDEKVHSDGSESEHVLPLPALQPLLEEEDEVPTSSAQSDDDHAESDLPSHERGMSLFDLEAGGDSYGNDEDDEEEQTYSQYEQEASTPVVDQARVVASLQKTPVVSLEGQALSLSSQSDGSVGSQSARSSGTSSLATPGPASLGDLEDHRLGSSALENGSDGEESVEDMAEGEVEEEEEFIGPYSRDRKDRPEFIREWSFQQALQTVRHSKTSQNNKGGKGHAGMRRTARAPSVDDFFGLLLCEQLEPLPPLQTTHSSLEMPPVYVETLLNSHDEAPTYGEATAGDAAYHPRQPSSKGRPPVARSAYVRDSVSSSIESGGMTRSGTMGSTAPSSRSSMQQQVAFGGKMQQRNGSLGMAAAAATTMVGGGSRALSRVSLQGLTSAFSGLGGYLAGSSGAAVHAAAAAGTVCGKGMDDVESRNPSIYQINAVRRVEGDDYDEEAGLYGEVEEARQERVQSMAGLSGVKRFSSNVRPTLNAVVKRPMSSSTTASSSTTPYIRRFINREDVSIPSASPSWSLDFLPCTEAPGGPSAFSV
ncbi:unnamed protein product [Sympodiomycopsis kandeliae]